MTLIINILDMIPIFYGNCSVIEKQCFNQSCFMTSIISLIATPIIMAYNRMNNLMLAQFINV